MQALFEWGSAGLQALRDHVQVLIIVDVLSFCTAVDVVVSRGSAVLPAVPGHAADTAEQAGALLAGRRREGGPSLSPPSLAVLAAGTRIVLPSPNGARLSLQAPGCAVFAGCLRNAAAVARAAQAAGERIGVVAAGERWPDDTLRPAIEDLFGAGAILAALELPLSAEARVARNAFRSAEPELANLIAQSMSGRELIERGFPQDVAWAVQHNVSTAAPLLCPGPPPYFATDCKFL